MPEKLERTVAIERYFLEKGLEADIGAGVKSLIGAHPEVARTHFYPIKSRLKEESRIRRSRLGKEAQIREAKTWTNVPEPKAQEVTLSVQVLALARDLLLAAGDDVETALMAVNTVAMIRQ